VLTHEFRQTATLKAENFSPDTAAFTHSNGADRIVAISMTNATLVVWDVATRKVVLGPAQLAAGGSTAKFVALTSDGKKLALGPISAFRYSSPGVAGVVIDSVASTVWDSQTGNPIGLPFEEKDSQTIEHGALSSDGSKLVTSSFDHIHVWDTLTRTTKTGQGHFGAVYPVAFSADGSKVVSVGSYDKRIIIWDAATVEPEFGPHAEYTTVTESVMTTIVFSPDGEKLAMAFQDARIIIIDVATGDIASDLTHFQGQEGLVTSLVFSPDGKWIASAAHDGKIRVWDATTGLLVARPLKGHLGAVMSVAFSEDGKNIVSSSTDGSVRVWALK
jgi:WD40 repeat protein